jgi:hypothetical protein
MNHTLPPTEWLSQNSEFVENTKEDSILQLHVTAQQVVGEAVKNLRWIMVSVEVKEETCVSMTSSNILVPDAGHLKCLCRPGYRPTDAMEAGTSCTYCSNFDPICRGTDTQCISCFGGAAVVARAGFYIEQGSVFSCDRKRCVGPPDDIDQESNSQSFGTLSPTLCGEPERAVTDGLGNCCAPGHHGKLCAYCNPNFEWSGTSCIECVSPDFVNLALQIALQCLLVIWISISKRNRMTPAWSGKPWRSRPSLFVPLNGDLPLESGGELQNLSFWWQTFNMLGVSEDSGSMVAHTVNLVFGMDLGTGTSACLFPFRSFFLRFYVNLFLPPMFHVICALAFDRVLSSCRKRGTDAKGTHHVRAVLFDIAVMNMSPALQKATKHWFCTTSDDQTPFGDTSVLHSAPFISCSGGFFQVSRAVTMCVCLALALVFPAWVGVQLRKRKYAVAARQDDVDHMSDLHDRCTIRVSNIPSADCQEDRLMQVFEEHGALTVTCQHHAVNRFKSMARAVHAQYTWSSAIGASTTLQVGAMVYHSRHLFGVIKHIEEDGCMTVQFDGLKTATEFESFAGSRLVLVHRTADGGFDREEAVAVAAAGFDWALVSFRSPPLAFWALHRGWTPQLGDTALSVSHPNSDLFQGAGDDTHYTRLWELSRQKFKQKRKLLHESGYGAADGSGTGLSALVGSRVAAVRQSMLLGSVYWNSNAAGSKCRRDWLVHQYSNVREECWWWNAALLLRRSVIAVIFSRRNLVDHRGGTQFVTPIGASADWRVCVVVVLCVQLFLSGYYDPYRFAGTNTFSDLSLYLLIVLYVGYMMDEENFFMILGMLSLILLCVSLGLIMLVKSKTVSGWQRARVAALATSISPSFVDRRERRGLKSVVAQSQRCEKDDEPDMPLNHGQLEPDDTVAVTWPGASAGRSSALPPLRVTLPRGDTPT